MAVCYMLHRLKETELVLAVESYYWANWKSYQNGNTGELRPLDEVKDGIREHILRAKKKYFFRQEFERLCQNYHIVFIGSGS